MIFYATKETFQRYKLKTPEELKSGIAPYAQAVIRREKGNGLYEWGCKLFYFDRRKCLQVMHFETKFVLFLVDVKISELQEAVNAIPQYLMYLYSGDADMLCALERYISSSPFVCFDRITDKSIISSMNAVQRRWAMDGYRFYDYIQDGVLHTKRINREVNDMPVMRKVDGREEWFIPYKRFEETIKRHFLNTDRRRGS